MPPLLRRNQSGRRQSRLPSCHGPKLGPFAERHLPLEFVRLLSDAETAAHSYVFEIKVGDQSYALKVFRYYDIGEDEAGLSDDEMDDPDLLFHIDPFYAECRAFGRIHEQGKGGTVAVHCFGYLLIPEEREAELRDRFEAGDWDRPESEYDGKPVSRQPFRAIVKSLVAEDTVWNARTSKKILKNLKTLHALGICMLDVRAENIVGGQFVDFSTSWTEPHILLRLRGRGPGLSAQERDLLMFDAMMEDEKVPNAPRALPDREYCQKLRSASS